MNNSVCLVDYSKNEVLAKVIFVILISHLFLISCQSNNQASEYINSGNEKAKMENFKGAIQDYK